MEGEIAMQGIDAFGFAEETYGLFDGGGREVFVAVAQKVTQNITQDNFIVRTFDIHAKGRLIFQRVKALQGGELEGGFGSAFWHGYSFLGILNTITVIYSSRLASSFWLKMYRVLVSLILGNSRLKFG